MACSHTLANARAIIRAQSTLAKVFLVLVTVSCILNISLSVVQMATGISTLGTSTASDGPDVPSMANSGESDCHKLCYYYSSLEILTVLFFLFFAWDGVLTENVFEVYAFQIASFLVTVYAVIQYVDILAEDKGVKAIEKFQLAIILLFQIAFLVMGYLLRKSFGWWVFRKVGADLNLKRLYRNYQIFIAQIKFDLQFSFFMVMMSAFWFVGSQEGSDGKWWQPVIELIAFVFAICWQQLGVYAVRHEDKTLMKVFFALSVMQPINIMVKVIILSQRDKLGDTPVVQMGLTAGLSMVNRVTALFNAVVAYRNFGFGLKENAFDNSAKFIDDMTNPQNLMPGQAMIDVESDDDDLSLYQPPVLPDPAVMMAADAPAGSNSSDHDDGV